MKFSLLLLSAATCVVAVTPGTRFNGGCALVGQKIYCYGGRSSIGGTSLQSLNDHYSLDISKDFNVSTSYTQWTALPSQNFELEKNCLFPIVPLRRVTGYLIYGGLGQNNTRALVNKTTVYHADTDTWTTVDTKTYQVRGALAALDASDRIWVWGGVSEKATGYPNGIGYWDAFSIIDASFMWQGVSRVTYLPQNVRRIGSTATMSSDNNIIYYIGGYNAFMDSSINQTAPAFPNPYTLNPARMSDILTFDTVKVAWTLNTANGDKLPTPRQYHTAVQLPNSDLIAIYGGAAPSDPDDPRATADDYFYTLNTTNFIWTQITDLGPLQGAGPRFGHSAILHNNSMLILFGMDSRGQERNDFHVMDVVHWKWTSLYRADGLYDEIIQVPSDNSSNNNVGLIVGVVVGVVVGGGAIAGLIVFFLIRRKRQRKHQALTTAASSDLNDNKEEPSHERTHNGPASPQASVLHSNREGSHYYSDTDNKARTENVPFFENPAPPYNDYHLRQGDRNHTPSTTLIMTPTDPANAGNVIEDLEASKPDGQIPFHTMEPVKPDGI
ncbi:hypothetical protein EC973_005636 [Apophysomyces ossiformis]|uniref:Galactose oxidase n=1 Tax=Apophysomyces ossiformis TaxID=679940 RepID=A0A8H7EPD2_9FUNG|nr:hypothetical protein EC973_005636 [Apophysomyces ossiformis]